MSVLVTLVLSSLASCLMYLSFPQQLLGFYTLPVYFLRFSAISLWALSAVILSWEQSLLSTIFTQVSLVMLSLAIMPFASAWLTKKPGKNPGKKQAVGHPTSNKKSRDREKIIPIQPHWFSKTALALTLGATLAFALVGIFSWIGPGGIHAANKVQFNMWLMPILWMITFSLVYFFRNRFSAALSFVVLNILAYGVLFCVRTLL